ncbi:MAG: RNA methyltransferase [Bdellovibrionaceae bacterium]|nr:RNA methyltransferase [Pseudobdellovibrionaceae bacterium]
MNFQSRVQVVLIRSIYPRNIGMCARAMANMGVSRLILVAPQCELTEEAKQGATSAQQILRDATIYPSLRAFDQNEGGGLRFAFSARAGKLRIPDRFDVKLEALKAQAKPLLVSSETPLQLFFGPEDDGLNDEEIRLANHVCALPTYGDFFSMNLSHAVMLALYTMRMKFTREAENPLDAVKATRLTPEHLHEKSEEERAKEIRNLRRTPRYFPEETLKTWLEVLGFEIDSRRVNALRVLNRILLENEPTPDELRVLEAILQQTIRKLRQ